MKEVGSDKTGLEDLVQVLELTGAFELDIQNRPWNEDSNVYLYVYK